jgi:uncharacterized protein YwqG
MTDIYKWLFGPRGRAALLDPPDPLLDLPAELDTYRAAIAATVLPIIGIDTSERVPTSRTASQLGGRPWWPKALAFPTAKDSGAPLYLLAQINFADVPPLPSFPRAGLLQVFIANNDTFGCDYENPAASPGFHCAYHTDLKQPALKDLGFLVRAPEYSPLATPLVGRAMTFQRDSMAIDPSDYRLIDMLGGLVEDDEAFEAYCEWHAAPAIRLGGYPTFTQSDPREYGQASASAIGDVNLLTIDTADGIMFGDSGATQMLMRQSDLEARNFKRVAYNWDCC